MKKCILLLLFLCLFCKLHAQDTIATIPLKKHTSHRNLQGDALGDSVFLMYDAGSQDLIHHSVFIMPDKTVKNIDLPEMMNAIFLGMISKGDSIYFYYIKEENKSVSVRAVVLDKALERKSFPSWQVPITKNIMTTWKDKNLTLVYANNEKQIRIMAIHGLSVVSDDKYDLSYPLDKKIKNYGVVHDRREGRPVDAAANSKVFIKDHEIWMITDQNNGYDPAAPAKTQFIRIDSTSYRFKIWPDKEGKSFSTYVHNDLIYKIRKDRGLQVLIYNFDGKLLHSFSLDKHVAFAKEIAYVRDEAARRVFNDRTVWDAMANVGSPFISVYSLDSGKTLLKIGTHTDVEKGLPIVPGLGPLSLVMLAASITKMAMEDATSLDHYFYMVGTPATGFQYTNASGLLSQAIDIHELYNSKFDYKYKGYLQTSNSTYCIYRINRGEDELRVVKFSKK